MVEGKCNAVKKNMGSYFENSAGLFYRAPAPLLMQSFMQISRGAAHGRDVTLKLINLSEILLLCPFI